MKTKKEVKSNKEVAKQLSRAVIDFESEKIKGYPTGIFVEMLDALDVQNREDTARVVSNFKTIERINNVFALLGKKKAQSLAEM